MMIKVKHENGYSGVLYGESSLSVYNPDGTEVLHTGFRKVNTEQELYDLLERVAELWSQMSTIDFDGEDENDDI